MATEPVSINIDFKILYESSRVCDTFSVEHNLKQNGPRAPVQSQQTLREVIDDFRK